MKTHSILWIERAGLAARVCVSVLALAATTACGDDKGDDDASTTLTTTNPSTDPTGTGTATDDTGSTDTVTPTTGSTAGDDTGIDDTGIDDTGLDTGDDTSVITGDDTSDVTGDDTSDVTGSTDDTGVDDTGAIGPSFAVDVHGPIIAQSCGCHVGGAGGLTLGGDAASAYAAIVGVPSGDVPAMNYISPGDPNNSYLLHKVLGTHADVGGDGKQMPLNGAPLSQDKLDTITAWITLGAQP